MMKENQKKYIDKVVDMLVKRTELSKKNSEQYIQYPFPLPKFYGTPSTILSLFATNVHDEGKLMPHFRKYCEDTFGLNRKECDHVWVKFKKTIINKLKSRSLDEVYNPNRPLSIDELMTTYSIDPSYKKLINLCVRSILNTRKEDIKTYVDGTSGYSLGFSGKRGEYVFYLYKDFDEEWVEFTNRYQHEILREVLSWYDKNIGLSHKEDIYAPLIMSTWYSLMENIYKIIPRN